MQCPNCRVECHYREDEWREAYSVDNLKRKLHIVSLTLCPSCSHPIVEIAERDLVGGPVFNRKTIYPILPEMIQIDPAVPETQRNDFLEAGYVLDISPKASAALSRRILQSVLKEQGYTSRDLAKQIIAVLNEPDPDKRLPLATRNTIDAVRNFGNFSAHQQQDPITSEVIDVEPEEARWCLEIVLALFEHYYARPAADAKKLDDLNLKLGLAGKSPAK